MNTRNSLHRKQDLCLLSCLFFFFVFVDLFPLLSRDCLASVFDMTKVRSCPANSWPLPRHCLGIGISLTILAMLLALHNLYPSLRPYTQPFFELSYHDPASNTYVQGWNDVYFVASATLALTAIRAIVIEWVIQPLGRSLGLKRKAALRLAEQGWQVLYYGFIWSIGLVCLWLEYFPLEKCGVWRADIFLISSFCSTSGRIPTIGSISAPFGMSGRRVRSVVS